MKPGLLFVCVIFFLGLICDAQKENEYSKLFIGPGIGLDYGGLGVRAEFDPIKNLSIIGGIGYNLFSIPGMNAGISYKFYESKRTTFHVATIYGYNAIIRIQYTIPGVKTYTDVQAYYGASLGAGCNIFDKNKKNKLTIEIWIPFRDKDFKNRKQGLKDMGIDMKPPVLPVTLSVGYNFLLNKNKK